MDAFRSTLKKYWGYDDFRGIQRNIIESIHSGHDTLGLMPTGGGKSITFQVPALMQDGVCIVVTPLIALMKDQVFHLRKRGVTAAAIYSGMSRHEMLTVLENCVFGGVRLLYVSPERLGTELFQVKLRHMKVSFITVDEAHCISQWGYDFRPSYLQISDIRKLVPHAPVLALTATATPEVIDDIQRQLHFNDGRVYRMSFERRNLSYVVRHATDKNAELLHILNSVDGSAIVYVRSRRRTREIAQWLTENGIKSTYYHAGLEPADKDLRQKQWQQDEWRVMVATNAFGMGIDKADVRLVIHIDCPDSPEAYFQEAGRAGRDGKRAWAVLLHNSSDDRKLHKRISDTFPEKDYIREVYDHLAYFFEVGIGSGYDRTFLFEIERFCHNFHHFPVPVHSALQILSRSGYIEYDTDPDHRARVMFTLSRQELDTLHQLSPTEEKIITAMLRLYGGLFVDYVYIEESMVAHQSGVPASIVYDTLKALRQRHILDFIPQRSTPLITYSQSREDGKDVVIPTSVYEERLKQYVRRIECMIEYATESDECRSTFLLRYFGEKGAHPCGHCDVCADDEPDTEDATKQIMQLLADGTPHTLAEVSALIMPRREVEQALTHLLHEERVRQDGDLLRMA